MKLLRAALALCLCGWPLASAAASVPLVEGLSVTTAIAEPDGDYESHKRLDSHDGDVWRLLYHASLPRDASGTPRSVVGERLVHDEDLQAARTYRSRFEGDSEEDYPGTTALGASSIVLRELRGAGKSRFALVGEDHFMRQALSTLGGGASDSPLALAGALMAGGNVSFKGELVKQSAGTLSVLVNGHAQALPVLVASGRFTAKNGQGIDAELSFLDDEANPLALQWRIGESTLRVVRIDLPVVTPDEPALSKILKQDKRITLPGLYFDFGSAVLRPESDAALKTIADAVREVPGALRLEGHTDNVGNAPKNLALSRARAEAVRAALIALDASLATRLQADGFGAARPQASNATLEGRAQNRRVELVMP